MRREEGGAVRREEPTHGPVLSVFSVFGLMVTETELQTADTPPHVVTSLVNSEQESGLFSQGLCVVPWDGLDGLIGLGPTPTQITSPSA